MLAAVITYIKYIINIYYKSVELFIRFKIILSRKIRVGIALDFSTFPLDWVVNKIRLRLDIIFFYNIIRLLVLDDYLLIKEKTELVRKKSGLTEKILKNNQSPNRLTSPINNEKMTSNGFIKQ